MWTCIKCGHTNDDQHTTCQHCGAVRSAGRFGSAQPPRNSAAYAVSQQASHAAVHVEPTPQQMPQAQYVPDFTHVRAGKGFMALGAVLAILLAVLTVGLAVLRHDDWARALRDLLLPAQAQNAEIPFVINYLLYGLLTLLAALLAALPGLWTLGLGKMLRRLNRMEELL